jgi:hypothetical protein
MKWLAMIIAGLSLVVAGADAAKAADAFEFVTVPGATAEASRGLFRINVASGQVVTAWGGAKTYVATIDPAPLPAGEYHLRITLTLDQKGGWNMERFDSKTGRTWSLNGGGNAPFTWSEITEAQQ